MKVPTVFHGDAHDVTRWIARPLTPYEEALIASEMRRSMWIRLYRAVAKRMPDPWLTLMGAVVFVSMMIASACFPQPWFGG